MDPLTEGQVPPAEAARRLYQKGLDLKKAGDTDAALTEFRRAVLADSHLQRAHYEIGLLCRTKANLDPMYMRHAFEAFRQAARLDLTHQEAHDQYIMAAQKYGRLDELLHEYDGWAKHNPENELIKKCAKNIVTISMAMIPEKVNVGSSGMSGTMRKGILFGAIGFLLMGLGMIGAPVAYHAKLAAQAKQLVTLGLILVAVSVGGFIAFSKSKN